ncbi:MAG: ribonuclease HII [Kiritimatiellia bacterium]
MLAPERAAIDSGVFRIAGVDEAGRGPLAGPVVAAAVQFPPDIFRETSDSLLSGLTDSKCLSAKARNRLLLEMRELPGIHIGVGICSVIEIDELNILRSTHLAMHRALLELNSLPELALIDGLPVQGLPCPSRSIVKGDKRCFSIAAASIVAKEFRDALMRELDLQYPAYGFARHKGYGTRHHLQALCDHGPCPVHRHSFAPVRAVTRNESR